MSTTFSLPRADNVRVSLPDNLTQEQLLEFPAFKQSLADQRRPDHEFHAAPYHLRRITVQSADWFAAGAKLGFVKLVAQITNDRGEWLPGAVFLRGPSVGMMVTLQPDDVPATSDADLHVLLVVQPRIAAASLGLTELPAGMVDENGTFGGTAAKEIKEELGLEIPESQLINMTALALPKHISPTEEAPQGVFPSPGGCDEFIPLFLHQRRVPRSQLQDWTGRLSGLRDEGEKITLKLVKLDNVWWEGGRDAKALAALTLYQNLKRVGKI